jgi:N-acylneuraminate cytidylyltransferase
VPELRVLGVIPVRGGSKGIPRKNLHPLGGKPLIQYTIDAACASRRLTDFVVSTEDAEIASVATRAGARVVERPRELATDEAPTLPVIQHAVAAVEAGDARFDYVFTLQVTTPFRRGEDIVAAIALAESTGAVSVIGVVRVYDTHPARIKRIENGRLGDYFPEDEHSRRQDLPPAYLRNGAVYLTRRDVLDRGALKGKDQVPFEMPPERSVNIDEPIDFLLAEQMLRQLC